MHSGRTNLGVTRLATDRQINTSPDVLIPTEGGSNYESRGKVHFRRAHPPFSQVTFIFAITTNQAQIESKVITALSARRP